MGFIKQKNGQEVFFRRSSINTVSRLGLAPGDRVNFEVEETENGLQAKNIKKA
jgi:cold shock CspA family protein